MKRIRKEKLSHADLVGHEFITVIAEKSVGNKTKSLTIRTLFSESGQVYSVFQILINDRVQNETERLDSAIYWYNQINLRSNT